jgi:hypothetical protein
MVSNRHSLFIAIAQGIGGHLVGKLTAARWFIGFPCDPSVVKEDRSAGHAPFANCP